MREGLLSSISIARTSAYATHTLRICLMRAGLFSSLSIVACSMGELRSMNKSFRSSCIRQHTSAYVIRQHTPAYASIRHEQELPLLLHTSAYVIRQHTPAYASIRHEQELPLLLSQARTAAYAAISVYGSIREHTPLVPGALRSCIRQQTSVYASIRQHTPRMLTNVGPERRRHTRELSAQLAASSMLAQKTCRFQSASATRSLPPRLHASADVSIRQRRYTAYVSMRYAYIIAYVSIRYAYPSPLLYAPRPYATHTA